MVLPKNRITSLRKTVGLITGCFDILHGGHIDLFNFAKKKVDYLIVGVESDKYIENLKGPAKPINNLQKRIEQLSKIENIDLIFPINISIKNLSQNQIQQRYGEMCQKINPDYLITNIKTDKLWKIKKKEMGKRKIGFLGQKEARPISSTAILESLEK